MSFNPRRRVYLMRHGSVTYFDTAGKPVLPEMVPLNEQGRLQASAAGRVFAEHAVRFDRVIVSGLPRTVETATRVLAETGQQIALEEWPDLAEIRGGKLAAIPDAELREAFTGAFEGIAPEHKRFLGGEASASWLIASTLPSTACAPRPNGIPCCWYCTAASTARSCHTRSAASGFSWAISRRPQAASMCWMSGRSRPTGWCAW